MRIRWQHYVEISLIEYIITFSVSAMADHNFTAQAQYVFTATTEHVTIVCMSSDTRNYDLKRKSIKG